MSVVATLYEPRWHGFARWEISLREPHGDHLYQETPLEHGWTRRRRGARCIDLTSTTARWQAFYLNEPDWDAK